MSSHYDPEAEFNETWDRWFNGTIWCYLVARSGLDGNDPYDGTILEYVRDVVDVPEPDFREFVDIANDLIVESRWERVAEDTGSRI